MRLWTLHPRYLDAAGLVALWREGLLARAVLRGRTRGYRQHPQLERFRSHAAPRSAINRYLAAVLAEAASRGYAFDRRKIAAGRAEIALTATAGQLAWEWRHLLRKLRKRNPTLYRQRRRERSPDPHPLFRIVPGGIESWERTNRRAYHQRGATLRPNACAHTVKETKRELPHEHRSEAGVPALRRDRR